MRAGPQNSYALSGMGSWLRARCRAGTAGACQGSGVEMTQCGCSDPKWKESWEL